MTNEIINSELMNEEQLNAVVGGTRGELSCDTKFLHAIGLMDHFYDPGYVENHADEVAAEVRAAIQKTGDRDVQIDYYADGKNEYYLSEFVPGGRSSQMTSRRKLYESICMSVGKPDFNYEQYL